jgi:hypothetical protein
MVTETIAGQRHDELIAKAQGLSRQARRYARRAGIWAVRWTRPEGGLFVRVTLREGNDRAVLLMDFAPNERMSCVTGCQQPSDPNASAPR